MAKKQQKESHESTSAEPTPGFLEQPAEPESTPYSMATAVLEDMKTNPIKRKAGRPRKEKPDPDMEEVLPPAHLREDEEADEADEAEDDTEQLTEAIEGDDDKDEPELKDQLRTLAEEHGVDFSEIEDAESVAEAQRYIRRLYRAFYDHGQLQENGHANGDADSYEPPARQERVQTKAEDADQELDFADYDEEDKTPKNFKALKAKHDALAKRVEAFEKDQRRRQEAELERAKQWALYEFTDELQKREPELFGAPGKPQTVEQQRRYRDAVAIGNQLMMGAAALGKLSAGPRAFAVSSINMGFADELTKKQLLAKREKVAARAERRIGAPAKVGRRVGTAVNGKQFEGPMEEDPNLLAAVSATLSRNRG